MNGKEKLLVNVFRLVGAAAAIVTLCETITLVTPINPDCKRLSFNDAISSTALDGQIGHADENTGGFDPATGEPVPMHIDGYVAIRVETPTNIIMNNGKVYNIVSFEYVVESCGLTSPTSTISR